MGIAKQERDRSAGGERRQAGRKAGGQAGGQTYM